MSGATAELILSSIVMFMFLAVWSSNFWQPPLLDWWEKRQAKKRGQSDINSQRREDVKATIVLVVWFLTIVAVVLAAFHFASVVSGNAKVLIVVGVVLYIALTGIDVVYLTADGLVDETQPPLSVWQAQWLEKREAKKWGR